MSQAAIDAIAAPPTHCYALDGLRPLGPLAARMDVIYGLCPDFFWFGDTFLDVGANKGYFSLKAQAFGRVVTSVEPDSLALAAWANDTRTPDAYEAPEGTVRQLQCTFKDLDPAKLGRFDTVWVGNGPHYLFAEDREWIARLNRLASDRVVMEGPVGRACRDVADWENVQEESEILAAMVACGFSLRGRANSPSYTPDRAVWHFRRVR